MISSQKPTPNQLQKVLSDGKKEKIENQIFDEKLFNFSIPKQSLIDSSNQQTLFFALRTENQNLVWSEVNIEEEKTQIVSLRCSENDDFMRWDVCDDCGKVLEFSFESLEKFEDDLD